MCCTRSGTSSKGSKFLKGVGGDDSDNDRNIDSGGDRYAIHDDDEGSEDSL